MSSVKRTLAYWKQFLFPKLAMIKQLGIPTYFLTVSCAVLRTLSHQELCILLNNNPVLEAWHCQYKVEVFFIEIILDGLLGKTKYGIHIEFQERGTPHIH